MCLTSILGARLALQLLSVPTVSVCVCVCVNRSRSVDCLLRPFLLLRRRRPQARSVSLAGERESQLQSVSVSGGGRLDESATHYDSFYLFLFSALIFLNRTAWQNLTHV